MKNHNDGSVVLNETERANELYESYLKRLEKVIEQNDIELSSLLPEILAKLNSDGDYQTIRKYMLKIAVLLGEKHLFDDSLKMCRQLRERAKSAEDEETFLQTFVFAGMSLWNMGDHQEARAEFLEGIGLKSSNTDDELGAKLYRGLGLSEWKLGNMEEALSNFRISSKIWEKLDDKIGIADLHNCKGVIYKQLGNWDLALEEYSRSLELQQELGNSMLVSKLYNNIGNLYLQQSKNQEAISYYQKSLAIAQENKDIQTTASLMNNMGLILFNMNEFEKSIKYHEEALELRKTLKNRSLISSSLRNLGFALEKIGRLEEAMENISQALEIEKELGDPVGQATTYSFLGSMHMAKEEYEKAEKAYTISMELYKDTGDRAGVASDMITLGSLNMIMGKYKESEDYFEQGLALAEELKMSHLMKDAYLGKSELEREKKDFEKAYQFLNKYIEYRNIVDDEESKKVVADIRAKYELEKQEKEAEIYRLKNIELAAAVSELEKFKEVLEQRVIESVEEVRKKDAFMISQSRLAEMGKMVSFIAHQWKQPLNTVSLIAQNLQDAIEFDELTTEMVNENAGYIVKQVYFMSKTIDNFRNFYKPVTVKSRFNIAQVIRDTVALLKASFDNHNIKLNLALADDCEITGVSNELSQVILILLNNARDVLESNSRLKEGWIKIDLKKDAKKLLLTIEDNGGGVNEESLPRIFDPYFSSKSEKKGTGLGLYIARIIIEEKFKGSISVSNSSFGAVFSLEFALS